MSDLRQRDMRPNPPSYASGDTDARIAELEAENARLAGIVEKLSKPDMFWDWDDGECGVESPDEYLIENDLSGRIYCFEQAHRLSPIFLRVEGTHDDDGGEPKVVEATKEQWQEQRQAEKAKRNAR